MTNIDRIEEYQGLCQMLNVTPRNPSVHAMPQHIEELLARASRTPGSPYYLNRRG